MKKRIVAIYYGFRRMYRIWSNELKVVGVTILLITCVIIGYTNYGKYISSELPTEAKYLEYEKIIKQLGNGELRNIKLPKNTSISLKFDGDDKIVVVKNDTTEYSVTGKLSESESGFDFKRNLNKLELTFKKVIVGAVIFGLILFAASCTLIWGTMKVISQSIDLISNLIEVYRDMKDKLYCKVKGKKK